MKTINDLISPYRELETSVRSLMSDLFSGTCGSCTACCCRADICEESINSAFLNLLIKKQGLSSDDMDDRIGWLDLSGCTLEYGKPPICYSYYCDQLLARIPDDESRFVTQVLGKLMHHVGQNANGTQHLVETWSADELNKVDVSKISAQLDEARSAFEVVQRFFLENHLSFSDRSILTRITTEEP